MDQYQKKIFINPQPSSYDIFNDFAFRAKAIRAIKNSLPNLLSKTRTEPDISKTSRTTRLQTTRLSTEHYFTPKYRGPKKILNNKTENSQKTQTTMYTIRLRTALDQRPNILQPTTETIKSEKPILRNYFISPPLTGNKTHRRYGKPLL